MTRNLDGASRCPKCTGLVRAGRTCKRCATLEAKALRKVQREQDTANDRARAAEEAAAASGARRIYLHRYVREFLSQPHGERCAWAERNPMELW